MFQQCPHCMTLLTVTNEQLGDSIVCDHCQTRVPITATSNNIEPIIDTQAQTSLFIEALHPEPASTVHPLRWRWLIISLFLVLLLAGQTTYFKRNELAENTVLRPWLHRFCLYLDCELKLLRQLDKLRIISREVRSHPDIHNTLLINLTIRNEALFRQPWPTLQLTFSDINNRALARRSFSPQDYLPIGSTLADGMPSQVLVHTSLVLVDPGKDAVNFIFDFY